MKVLPITAADCRLYSSVGFLMVVLGVGVPLLWIHLSQFSLPGYACPVSPQFKAMDLYRTVLSAGALGDAGGNPYAGPEMITRSPIALILHAPLTYVSDFNTAFALYQALTVVVMVASLGLLARWAGFGFWGLFAVTAVAIFTYPFQLHYERGQIDAFSTGAAIFACFLARRGRLGWAFLLGLVAVQLKLNSLVLVIPFLLGARLATSLKRSALFLGLLAASFLLTPTLSSDFLLGLVRRSQDMELWNNGSIYRFFSVLPLGSVLASLFLAAVGGLLVLGIVKLHAGGAVDPVLTGLFWMLPIATSYPPTNFLYAYIFLPALVFSWCTDEESLPVRIRQARWLGCVGLSLALFPAGFLHARYGATFPFWIPPAGLFLMLVANAVIAFGVLKGSPGPSVAQA